jgi:hypothetical protein
VGLKAAAPVADRAPRAARRAAVLHHRRAHSRATLVGRRGSLRAAPAGGARRCPPSVRAAPAAPRPRHRARPRGRPAEHHPASTRARESRHDLDLPPRHRPRGDHRRRPRPPCADDVCQRRAAPLNAASPSGSAASAPASPGPKQACEPFPLTLAGLVPSEHLVWSSRHARSGMRSGSSPGLARPVLFGPRTR